MLKIVENRKLLYDSIESDSVYNMDLMEGIKLKDILKFKFIELKEKLSLADFEIIINSIKAKNSKDLDFYKLFPDTSIDNLNYFSSEELQLYYYIKENNIFIYSFGELQPQRYILFCEGVFRFIS